MTEEQNAEQPDTRNRKTVMAEGFIQGGFLDRPVIVELPDAREVARGTVYQDAETGTIWKVINGGHPSGSWLQAETVTASEHAALKRKRLIYLVATLAVTVLGYVILGGAFPLPPAPWNFLIFLAIGGGILGFLLAWMRTAKPLAAHIVAPAPDEGA